MRNIFHQYLTSENRVTPALGHALASYPSLLGEFVNEFTPGGSISGVELRVQERPGDPDAGIAVPWL